ncbi:hypothetical protein QJS04_geneDACA023101 [Acorus gramineus]|uniref:Uncharacterized protein n=1 Tax=Acorus gramineus TaxID=55184 RepID=A0AAV8ZZH0_ACOGR|nr:hypothetical protein QJS04_geneDACA023101 [Acorus gramineus]
MELQTMTPALTDDLKWVSKFFIQNFRCAYPRSYNFRLVLAVVMIDCGADSSNDRGL